VDEGKTEGFFKAAKNADALGGLVENIRDTVMEYQVCIRKLSTSGARPTFAPDIVTARHL